jgi:AcrR family transcriptional regulator
MFERKPNSFIVRSLLMSSVEHDNPDRLERREVILAAAKRLLSHYGASKTTIADIAREAGVGVGTVYLDFPSKDAIVLELARVRQATVIDAMIAAVDATQGAWAERLSAAIEARVAAFYRLADDGAHACDVLHCSTPATKSANEQHIEREQELFAMILQRGASVGEFDLADSSFAVAALLQRAFFVFAPPRLFDRPRNEVITEIRALSRLLLTGLLKRHTPATR